MSTIALPPEIGQPREPYGREEDYAKASGQDTVTCPGCGRIVDVGWELRQHREEHRSARRGEE